MYVYGSASVYERECIPDYDCVWICVNVCKCVHEFMCVPFAKILQVGHRVVHELDQGGGHVLQHVLVDKCWHDGDSDYLATLVDQCCDLLVLHTHHILSIHLQRK